MLNKHNNIHNFSNAHQWYHSVLQNGVGTPHINNLPIRINKQKKNKSAKNQKLSHGTTNKTHDISIHPFVCTALQQITHSCRKIGKI